MSGLLVKSTLIMRENLEELNSRGLEHIPGAARRRRAHPQLRRARPAGGLRGPRLLRQGRLRGPPHDGHPDRGQADAATSTPTSAGPRAGGCCRRASRSVRRQATSTRPPIPARSAVAVDNPVFMPPFLGSRVAKGIAARRHRRLPQRDGAVPQPVAVPARARRARRATRSSRPGSARRCGRSWPRPRRAARSCRRWPGATSRSTPTATTSSCGPTTTRQRRAAALLVPAPAQGAVVCIADFFRPGRRRAKPTTPRSTS